MKAIMISIKPQWCALMMNGDKTKEVRKNKALASAIQKLIDEYGYADIYAYCSKDGYNHLHKLYDHSTDETLGYSTPYYKTVNVKGYEIEPVPLNGKVVFKFRCYKVDEIRPFFNWGDELEKETCLTKNEVLDYLNKNESIRGRKVLGLVNLIHISKLEIFDRPKEISEFVKYDNRHIRFGNCFIGFGGIERLTKAPQNMVYIEEEE